MTETIEQTIFIKAVPHEIYEVLMDSARHTALTGSEAKISRLIGGDYSAYDGYITGKNLELYLDKKIVQSWRAVDWTDNQTSVVTFVLTAQNEGTRLDFVHSNLPDGTKDEFTQGWIDNYWEPMKQYFK